MRTLKAQIFSYDLVFALLIVGFMIWYVMSASNALAAKVDYVEKENRMSEVAQSALDQLTESPGDPSNWSGFGANSIGLAESKGVLDSSKVQKLVSLAGTEGGYENARAMLSMNRQGGAFLFNLKVLGPDGEKLSSLGPKEPSGISVASTSRTMLMDGKVVTVLLKTWGIEGGVG